MKDSCIWHNLTCWTFGIQEGKFQIKRLGRWVVPKGFVLIYKMTIRGAFKKIDRLKKD
jgi:hypothetical protein